MNGWLSIDDKKKKLAYEQVAAKENLPPIAIEKDYWVTLVLESVFEQKRADSLVFKGGTSLSKGWNLIQRFLKMWIWQWIAKLLGLKEHWEVVNLRPHFFDFTMRYSGYLPVL